MSLFGGLLTAGLSAINRGGQGGTPLIDRPLYPTDFWKYGKAVADKIMGTEGLREDVKEAADALVTVLREDFGLPAFIAEGRRSQKRQDELYAQGRSRPGAIVTWTRDSKHVQGLAFDLGFEGLTPDRVPAQWWSLAGKIGQAIGLKWGGRWKVRDKPHFEV